MRLAYETGFGTGWIVFEGDTIVETILPGGTPPDTPISSDPPPEVERLGAWLGRYFNGDPTAWHPDPDLAARAHTPFLRAVYQVVSAILPGKVMTYGDVADAAGCPGGARAVGQAMARNPFAPIIPCHRVVPSSGGVGHYGGGSDLKRAMLEMEATAG
ncbi:MAG: methylated-DNA--[protein]-cysteine S-methyltransferase [Gammaproteobacteria bacterium]|nr:methylated-DNA--[protein]-cysteine S-methyltransferase [Gammaproteobacteria bacterium]